MSELNKVSIIITALSVIILIIYFVLFYKNVCDCSYLGISGVTLLIIGLILIIIDFTRDDEKERMSGFQAWVDKVDYIVEKYLEKSHNNDDRASVSNALVAASIKLDKNKNKNDVKTEMIFVRQDLLEKGVNNISSDLLYKMYKESDDTTYDLYREEINRFFNYIQNRRERIKEQDPDKSEIHLEELITVQDI